MTVVKKFVFSEDRPPISYRVGTSDEHIIKAVLIDRKEYSFPLNLEANYIFDIGANIGVVSVLLANLYPKAKIYAFEPVKENFDLLRTNTCQYENIYPMPVGLGSKTEKRLIHKSNDPVNFGGFSTFITDGEPDKEIDIIDVGYFCEKVASPDIIKIDVEGAEYEILSSMPSLKKVKWITGELHGVDEYPLLGILDRDFRLNLSRGFGDKVWHFHALSKTWTGPLFDQSPQ